MLWKKNPQLYKTPRMAASSTLRWAGTVRINLGTGGAYHVVFIVTFPI